MKQYIGTDVCRKLYTDAARISFGMHYRNTLVHVLFSSMKFNLIFDMQSSTWHDACYVQCSGFDLSEKINQSLLPILLYFRVVLYCIQALLEVQKKHPCKRTCIQSFESYNKCNVDIVCRWWKNQHQLAQWCP